MVTFAFLSCFVRRVFCKTIACMQLLAYSRLKQKNLLPFKCYLSITSSLGVDGGPTNGLEGEIMSLAIISGVATSAVLVMCDEDTFNGEDRFEAGDVERLTSCSI